MVIKVSDNRIFCSIECQGVWQSKTRVGENASNYDNSVEKSERIKHCNYCGKSYEVTKNKIKSSKFCSNECRRLWYSNIWSQSKEWREKSRIRAVKILESGLISQTNSKPQRVINKIIALKNIKYINEKGFDYFTLDTFLEDYNLGIEVMGDYWHCNSEKYPKIKYNHQKIRIGRDRVKKHYLKNKYNLNVLYLWESDIINNESLCSALIDEFILKNGNLKSYHSLDYIFTNNKLEIKNDKPTIYMELSKENVLDFLNIK